MKRVSPTIDARELVERLGTHPASTLGLILRRDAESEIATWLIASVLLGGRTKPAVSMACFRALSARSLSSLEAIGGTPPSALVQILEAADHPDAESIVALLQRLSRGLGETPTAKLSAIASECDGLEDLGARLSTLASGFGAQRITRFLQPLRDAWPAAAELPLDSAACAAAVHLGWIGEDEADPSALGGFLGSGDETDDATPIPLADLEAALAKLGRRACRRGRFERCPLGDLCPGGPFDAV